MIPFSIESNVYGGARIKIYECFVNDVVRMVMDDKSKWGSPDKRGPDPEENQNEPNWLSWEIPEENIKSTVLYLIGKLAIAI